MTRTNWERTYGTALDRPRMNVARQLLEARDCINSAYWGLGDEQDLMRAKEILENLIEKITISAWQAQARDGGVLAIDNDDETQYDMQDEMDGDFERDDDEADFRELD